MPIELNTPIIYLITDGRATNQTLTLDSERILGLVKAAVAVRVSLIQIREKNLSASALYELTKRAAEITAQSSTRLLVNDRADIAESAGADGVHLASHSLDVDVVRTTFGEDFLIGVSTHSLNEVRTARESDANFAVCGPVFETPSKSPFGSPLGIEILREAAAVLKPFCIVGIGGITAENASQVFEAGASGVAAIRAFSDPKLLEETVRGIRRDAVLL